MGAKKKRQSIDHTLSTARLRILVFITISMIAMTLLNANLTQFSQFEYQNREWSHPDPVFTRRISEAQKGLSGGTLIYTALKDKGGSEMKVGDSITFVATLVADKVTPAPSNGKGRKSAPTGAMMGAKLHCSGDSAECGSNSRERKPVLRNHDSASWSWTIYATKSGKSVISLTITAYLDDTETVLTELIPTQQEIEIHSARKTTASFAKSALDQALAIISAIGGLGALVTVLQLHRRSDQARSDTEDATADTNDAARPPQGQSGSADSTSSSQLPTAEN